MFHLDPTTEDATPGQRFPWSCSQGKVGLVSLRPWFSKGGPGASQQHLHRLAGSKCKFSGLPPDKNQNPGWSQQCML